MDRRTQLACFFSTLAYLYGAADCEAHTDVFKLDIYGVKLGMTGDEALAALRAKLGSKVKLEYQRGTGPYFRKNILDYIELQHGDYALKVQLTEATPDLPKQSDQVWSVTLRSQSYSFTGADSVKQQGRVEQEFIDDILKHYPAPDGYYVCNQQGCPTLKNGSPAWCEPPEGRAYEPCEAFAPSMREDTYYPQSGGGLGFELRLTNQRATQQAEYYSSTHQPKQHLSSSPFK